MKHLANFHHYQMQKTHQDLSQPALQWLTSLGSLTQKIEQFSGQKLIVTPLFEGRQTLSLTEKQQLNIAKNRPQSAWIRESALYGNSDDKQRGQAWILAKSIFPFDSLTGQGRALANLGSRPIGYLIFGRHGARLQQRWYQKTPKGWQRSSLYIWQGKPLLIREIFLPTFIQRIEDDWLKGDFG